MTITAVGEVPDFFEFHRSVMAQIGNRGPGVRIGQFVFNKLHDVRPDVANALRTTTMDPFHWNNLAWSEMKGMFWDRVIDLWEI